MIKKTSTLQSNKIAPSIKSKKINKMTRQSIKNKWLLNQKIPSETYVNKRWRESIFTKRKIVK